MIGNQEVLRSRFEKWAISKGILVFWKESDGSYVSSEANSSWNAWQAASDLSDINLPYVLSCFDNADNDNDMVNAVKDELAENGVTTK